jgi:hypothetical protein
MSAVVDTAVSWYHRSLVKGYASVVGLHGPALRVFKHMWREHLAETRWHPVGIDYLPITGKPRYCYVYVPYRTTLAPLRTWLSMFSESTCGPVPHSYNYDMAKERVVPFPFGREGRTRFVIPSDQVDAVDKIIAASGWRSLITKERTTTCQSTPA